MNRFSKGVFERMFWIEEGSCVHTQYSAIKGQRLNRPHFCSSASPGTLARNGFTAKE